MIQLITDTSCNLPENMIRDRHILMLPFFYAVNEKTPRGEFDGKAFYDAMRQGADVKTGMINPQQYRECFQAVLKEGKDILYIGMSGGISGSASAALATVQELQKEYPRKIAAVDSLAASLGEGLQVLQAAEDIRTGGNFEWVLARAESRRHRMCQYFTVEDLTWLRKGGRISGVTAAVGTLLQIKPILKGDPEGHIVSHARSRGMKGALMNLSGIWQRLGENTTEIGIAHADAPENAAFLEKLIYDAGFTGKVMKVCYEPVTGSHVGPGTVALFFWR